MNEKHGTNRRRFLTGVAAAAASVTLVRPSAVHAAGANGKVSVGIIGCGGRGGFLAGLFAANGHYAIAATHDYFADRSKSLGDKYKVPAGQRYAGLSGYKKLLASKVDAVVVASPPFFHPMQVSAGVDAGKHVYVAKPIAVDVPGCLTVKEAGRKATQNKKVVLVDFQTRVDPFYSEALKRVHAGAIGDFAFGECTYHCGRLRKKGDDTGPEGRLRNWVFDKALSGDIITEQNIHSLDVMSWIMNAPPVRAFGTCGRKVRLDVGDCNDSFAVTYEYPKGVGIAYSGRQFDAHGTQPDGIRNRMFGSTGVLEAQYGGQVMIRGKNFYRGGKSPSIYKDGAKANIAAFHKQITDGLFENSTVAPSVQSNLVTVLGRTAAYTGELVTWEKLLKTTDRVDGKLAGLKD